MRLTTTEGKELVALRRRPLKGGGYSLYLDFMLDGVRTREFLKMYLVPERDKIDRVRNRETLKVASAARAKRVLELQEGRAGIRHGVRRDMLLTDFLARQRESYADQGKASTAETLSKVLRWLGKYGRRTTLLTVDGDYVLQFCRYMRENGLSEGTVFMYFTRLSTLFNNAYREGLMNENPISRIDHAMRPKCPDSGREYLTLDEIRALSAARCGNESVKRAFLFACFTGLRISDIEALQWSQIRKDADGWIVEARQVKTRKVLLVPLSENALAQLPEVKERRGAVFCGLPNRGGIGDNLKRWMKAAGVAKHITFHCSRHTYATLLLTYGAGIYTVSSLLGHSSVQTTQVYARIVSEERRAAVACIPGI